MNSKSFNALQDFYKACSDFYEGRVELEAWRSAWESLRGVVAEEERIYPCAAEGCKVMRSKSEGGTVFTVCDKHWDEAMTELKVETHVLLEKAAETPEHMKLCVEKAAFQCCACGQECCWDHGMPLAPHPQGKQRPLKTIGMRRCTPCADAGR